MIECFPAHPGNHRSVISAQSWLTSHHRQIIQLSHTFNLIKQLGICSHSSTEIKALQLDPLPNQELNSSMHLHNNPLEACRLKTAANLNNFSKTDSFLQVSLHSLIQSTHVHVTACFVAKGAWVCQTELRAVWV